jgi:hypothetical protein
LLQSVSGSRPDDVQRKVDFIVNPSNQTAHKADMDPAFAGTCFLIAHTDVDDVMDFVEQLGETLVAKV